MNGTAAQDGASDGLPRVVIADDQRLVRTGFRMILSEAGIPVAAEAATGTEAVAAVLKHRPDVVLMDLLREVNRVALVHRDLRVFRFDLAEVRIRRRVDDEVIVNHELRVHPGLAFGHGF